MLGIVLTGHGGFATGLEKAMKQILGEQEQIIAVDFPEDRILNVTPRRFLNFLESRGVPAIPEFADF